MAKDNISDPLENLFSDFDIPEPQAAHEATAEQARDDVPQLYVPGPEVTVPPSRLEAPTLEVEIPLPETEVPPEPLIESVEPSEDSLESAPRPESIRESRRFAWHGFGMLTRRRQTKLARGLILPFLVAAIIISLIIGALVIFSQVAQARSNVIRNSESLATLQEDRIDQWIQSQVSAVSFLAREPTLQAQMREFLIAEQNENDKQPNLLSISTRLGAFQNEHPGFIEVFLLNANGQVAVSTDTQHQGQFEGNMHYYIKGRQESYYGPPVVFERWGRLGLVVAEPVQLSTEESIGVLVGIVDPEPLTEIMHSASSLGKTAISYLVNESGTLVSSIENKGSLRPGDQIQSPAIEKVIARQSGKSAYENFAGKTVLGIFHWLPQVRMGLLVEREVFDAFGSLFLGIGGTVILTLVAVASTASLAGRKTQRAAQPDVSVAEPVRQMVSGDLDQSGAMNYADETYALRQGFDRDVSQWQLAVTELEQQLAELDRQLQQTTEQNGKRATLLEVTAEISRAAALILDTQELMQTAVDLICTRFDFYHVSLYLLDESGEWAVVAASSGQEGRQMVAQSYRLRVGGDSLVGWVCSRSQARIALDIGADAVNFDNPLLPDTRSQLVMPLMVGDRLLGALDVQSTQEAAFDDDDVRSLHSLADHIGIALQHARLFTDTERGAWSQQLITRLSDRMRQTAEVADILALVAQDLGETFDLEQATICLGTEAKLNSAANGQEPKRSAQV